MSLWHVYDEYREWLRFIVRAETADRACELAERTAATYLSDEDRALYPSNLKASLVDVAGNEGVVLEFIG